MKNQRSVFKAALIALVCAFAFLFLYGVVLSMKDYRMAYGLGGSPWTGLASYERLTASYQFADLVGNGARLVACELLVALALGVPLAYLASALGARDRSAGIGAALVMLLPTFVPRVIWLAILKSTPAADWLIDPERFTLAYALLAGIPSAGIVACAGGLFAALGEARDAWKGALAAALMAAMRLLSPDIGTINLSYNPLVYQVSDTLGSNAYRNGLMNAAYPLSAAADVLRSLMQLAIAVIPAVVLSRLAGRGGHSALAAEGGVELTSAPQRAESGAKAAVIAPLALLAVGGIALIVGWFAAGANNASAEAGDTLARAARNTAVGAAGAVAVAFVVCYALFSAFSASGGVYCALVTAALLALGGQTAALYLNVRALGLINTAAPAMILSVFDARSLALMLVMGLAVRRRPPLNMWLAALGGALMVEALALGDHMAALIYTTSRELITLAMVLRDATLVQQTSVMPVASFALPLGAMALICGCSGAALCAAGLTKK